MGCLTSKVDSRRPLTTQRIQQMSSGLTGGVPHRALNQYAFRLLLYHTITNISNWANEETELLRYSGSKGKRTEKEEIKAIMVSLKYLCDMKSEEPRDTSSPCGWGDAP